MLALRELATHSGEIGNGTDGNHTSTLASSRDHCGSFYINTLNPVLKSSMVDMNAYPEAMWELLAQEQAEGLGWHYPIDETHLVWSIFPRNQYAPETGDNAHYMLSFRLGDRLAMPYNIPEEAKVPTGAHLQKFLMGDNTFLSYNITYGPNSWKQSSMTWENWHIHCCKIAPEALTARPHRDTKLFEPRQALRDDFFAAEFQRLKKSNPELLGILNKAEILEGEEKNGYGYLPTGLAFTLPVYVSAGQLFEVFEKIDHVTATVHRDVFTTCTDNYFEVENSLWRDPYTVRAEDDFEQQLEGKGDLEKEFYRRARQAIAFGMNAHDQSKRIYKSPCYSVALWQAGDKYVGVVDEHSFVRKGGVEGMGIMVSRKCTQDAAIQNRMTNALHTFHDANTLNLSDRLF